MKSIKLKTIVTVFVCFIMATLMLRIGEIKAQAVEWSDLSGLEKVTAYLDLPDLLPEELKSISIDTIISNLIDFDGNKIKIEGKVLAYRSFMSDKYLEAKSSDKINIIDEQIGGYYGFVSLDLVCGKSKDLTDPSNKIYSITPGDFLYNYISATAFSEADTKRTENSAVSVGSSVSCALDKNADCLGSIGVAMIADKWNENDPVAVSFSSPIKGVTATVYEGYYQKVSEIPSSAKDVTSKVWNNSKKGYVINSKNKSKAFLTFVLKKGKVTQCCPLKIDVSKAEVRIVNEFQGIYSTDEHGFPKPVGTYGGILIDNGINILIYKTFGTERTTEGWKDVSPEGIYCRPFTVFQAGNSSRNVSNYVKKAVAGLYDSLKDAASQPDIKDKLIVHTSGANPALFVKNGYFTDFSGDGASFTIFTVDDQVIKYTIRLIERKDFVEYIRLLGENRTGKYTDGSYWQIGLSRDLDGRLFERYVRLSDAETALLMKYWTRGEFYDIPDSIYIGGKNAKVTIIKENALVGSGSLKGVTIGANITTIEANAFAQLKNLETVVVRSKNIKKVDKTAFKGISKDTVFYFENMSKKEYKKIVKLFKKATPKGVKFVYSK